MRQFTLVGLALALLASSGSGQGVINVKTFKDGRGKTAIIEQVIPVPPPMPILDELGHKPACPPPCPPPCPPQCAPRSPLACMLADQPALLKQLTLLDGAMAGYVGALRVGIEDLPRPKPVDEKKPEEKKSVAQLPPEAKKVDDKKPDDKRVENTFAPAGMVWLELREKDWDPMNRGFVELNGRRWCLIKGCPLTERPLRLRGWLLKSDGEKLYFLDYFGNLYANTAGPLP